MHHAILYIFLPSSHHYDYPGYQRFFSRAEGIFGVAEGRRIFGRRPKPETALEKSLAPRVNYYMKLPNFTSPVFGVGEHNTKIVAFFFLT